MKKEIRTLTAAGLTVERRKNDDGAEKPIIRGYAAVFNKDSENLGGFVERIKPGAFKRALKKSDTRALVDHKSHLILGRKSAGTLRLVEDATGLLMEIDPPDTQYARDLMVSIDRGDVREQSFGFTVKSDTWADIDKPMAKRTINEVDELFDVSPVTFPAYPDTSVALRSLDQIKKDAATRATDKEATLRRNRNIQLLADTAERNL